MSVPEAARVLVVDDDLGLLRLVERVLQREGFVTATATSARDAIAWMATHTADLMLVDLKLRDLEGTQLIDRLASGGYHVPFIVITGQGDERIAVQMMKRGALDYVVKDANFWEFLPAVVHHGWAHVERERRLAAAERTLRENEERYRGTLDNMIEGCQTLGFDWRYLYVNRAAAQHGRRSVKELLGRTLMEVYPGVEKTPIFSKLAECMEKRVSCQLENEFVYKDGDSAWFQLSVQPVPEGLFILSLDITKRKESERRRKLHYDTALILAESASLSDATEKILRTVCETFGWSAGELWTVDPSANLLRPVRTTHFHKATSPVWAEATEQLSFPPGTGIPGRVWSSRKAAYFPNIPEDPQCPRGRLAKKLGINAAFAFPIMLHDEVLAVMCFFGKASRPPDEDLLNCFAALGSQIGQFIDRKHLEREILEISDREQSRIGRDLHDGLGQQLTALEFLSVSLAADLRRDAPNLAVAAERMAEHLREAVSQTRAIATGLSPLSLDERGLSGALRKLAEGIRSMTKVDCRLTGAAPVEVPEGSEIHLFRIAQEAVNNALKHGRAKRIRISLRKRGGLIRMVISDNGAGFCPEKARRGGMGLRAIQYRADLIGADLQVESRPGGGTRVTCTLRKPV